MSNDIKNILSEYVKGLFKIVGKELNKVILYGSYARGEQNLDGEISDIDIMILVNEEDKNIKNIQDKVLDYSYDFDLKYDILLSPIVESLENYNKRAEYIAFYKKIQKEGVLLNG